MRCACVDIGSNTTRLLVAEVNGTTLEEILAERAFTRLLRGRGPDGTLHPERIRAVADEVARQVRQASDLGCGRLRVVGTAAVRHAPNRAELLAAVREAAGVEVEILGGDEEAALAFLGATTGLAARPTAVVDVGGGSSELAIGVPGQGVTWSASVPVGSGMLADAHLHSDPPRPSELSALRAQARHAFDWLEPPPAELAVAVGGSATSLARLAGPVLDQAALTAALIKVVAAPAAVVAERHDLDPERARLLPAGLSILGEAARVLRAPLAVAKGGLREGLLLREAA